MKGFSYIAGVIISISSVVGITGNPGQANYAASKAAMIGMSKSLAQEVASRGITVNCVAPGQFRTEAFDSTYEDGVGDGFVDQPLPNIGDVSDIANGVIFLVSSGARFITGEVLYVDGGLILQGPMSALPADGYSERK